MARNKTKAKTTTGQKFTKNDYFAAVLYILRKFCGDYPVGSKDKGGRWYPASPGEEGPCCSSVRSPSRSYPFTLFKHCYTLKHICASNEASVASVRALLKDKNLPLLMGLNKNVDTYVKSKLKGDPVV